MSVMSEDIEDEEEDDEDSQDMDEFSPPLFIQFSLAISQDREDIVCAPVKHLPTCLGEIFQVGQKKRGNLIHINWKWILFQ